MIQVLWPFVLFHQKEQRRLKLVTMAVLRCKSVFGETENVHSEMKRNFCHLNICKIAANIMTNIDLWK